MSYLHAQIERITYTNEETGYAVAKVHAKGARGLEICELAFIMLQRNLIYTG